MKPPAGGCLIQTGPLPTDVQSCALYSRGFGCELVGVRRVAGRRSAQIRPPRGRQFRISLAHYNEVKFATLLVQDAGDRIADRGADFLCERGIQGNRIGLTRAAWRWAGAWPEGQRHFVGAISFCREQVKTTIPCGHPRQFPPRKSVGGADHLELDVVREQFELLAISRHPRFSANVKGVFQPLVDPEVALQEEQIRGIFPTSLPTQFVSPLKSGIR